MPDLHHDSRGTGALQVVLLVLGILFTLSGIGLLVEGAMITAASSSLGGLLGNLGATEEASGAFLLLAGILMIAGAVATWSRGKRRPVSRSKRAISTAHGVILVFGLMVLAIGVLLLVVAGGFYTPAPLVLLVLGAVLTFLGVAETFVESEGRRK